MAAKTRAATSLVGWHLSPAKLKTALAKSWFIGDGGGDGGGDADVAIVAFGRYIDSKLWRSPMRLA